LPAKTPLTFAGFESVYIDLDPKVALPAACGDPLRAYKIAKRASGCATASCFASAASTPSSSWRRRRYRAPPIEAGDDAWLRRSEGDISPVPIRPRRLKV
jgi:hypothetical protein